MDRDRRSPDRAAALGLALLLACSGAALAGDENDRVRRLYFDGLDAVSATLPSSKLEVGAETLPCVNCHGVDGRGGREGGTLVPPIDWRRLTMPSADRPAYDATSVARAVIDGIRSDGSRLHDLMPRYALPARLAEALPSFLATIGSDISPGVASDRIIVAAPSPKGDDPRAEIVNGVLRFYVDMLNRKGGVYGRTVDLIDDEGDVGKTAFCRLAALTPAPASSGRDILDLWPLDNGADPSGPFALIPSDERQLARLLKEARQSDASAMRTASLDDAAQPLPTALVFDGRPEQLEAFARRWNGPETLTIYTTTRHADPTLAERLPTKPLRIALANPLSAGNRADVTRDEAGLLVAARARGLPERALPIARAAWVAATLFEQALRQVGRKLDRERLVAAIDRLPPLETGLLPPVDPNGGVRSIGMVTFDLATKNVERKTLPLD